MEDEKERTYSKMKYVGVLSRYLMFGGIKAEKIKGLLLHGGKGMKGSESVKLLMITRSRGSRLKLFGLLLTYMLLLWILAVQFTGRLGHKLIAISRSSYSFPPPSMYQNPLLLLHLHLFSFSQNYYSCLSTLTNISIITQNVTLGFRVISHQL